MGIAWKVSDSRFRRVRSRLAVQFGKQCMQRESAKNAQNIPYNVSKMCIFFKMVISDGFQMHVWKG